MFLFKLIKSQECLHPGTEAHMCAFSSLWLSKSSKGKVLGLEGVDSGPEGIRRASSIPQITEIPQGFPGPPEHVQNLSNILRILVTPQELPEPQYHPHERPELQYHTGSSDTPQNLGHSPRTLRHWQIKHRLVRTMVSSCRRSRDPIAHDPPILALGSPSSTARHKSSTTPKPQ